MDALTRTVGRALSGLPISLREVARRAGVSHVQVARIANGERKASPAVAESIARVLEGFGAECNAQAKKVRRSLARPRRKGL